MISHAIKQRLYLLTLFPKYLNLTEDLRLPIFMVLLFRGKITDSSIEA